MNYIVVLEVIKDFFQFYSKSTIVEEVGHIMLDLRAITIEGGNDYKW